MNSAAAKAVCWAVVISPVLAVSFAATFPVAACGDSSSCNSLRTSLYSQKLAWGACDPSNTDECIKVPGNPKDCTGVLSCDFAVTRSKREAAEQAVLTAGQQSQGCYLCATPNCVSGDIAICEPVTRECILITSIDDSGAISQVSVDAGS